jgi:integrase
MADRERRNFSIAYINSLRAKPARYEVHDPRIPGWTCRVTSNGRKSFCFVYRHGGKHRRSTLGTWPVAEDQQKDALETYKQRALELQGAVAKGDDPVAEARAARVPSERTLAWAVKEYAAEKKTQIKTWKALERIFENHWVPALGDVPIGEIHRADLYDHVIKPLVRAGKHGAAGEAKKAISGLFNYAVDRDWVENNPATRLQVSGPPSRRRDLADDELAAVWIAAEGLGTPWRQAVRIILLTGCRRAEVGEARKSEINRDRCLIIPGDRYKTGRPHQVALVPAAWAELASLPGYLGKDPFLFSADGGLSPIRGWGRPKAKLDTAIEKLLGRTIKAWRLHDLRHTCRTRLAKLGVANDIAERVIGHTIGGVAGLYNHYEYEKERRSALERYAQHVIALVEGEKRAKSA